MPMRRRTPRGTSSAQLEAHMQVAVLGGGNGCFAAVADSTAAGHDVRWWRRDHQAFGPMLHSGTLHYLDHQGAHQVPVRLYRELAEAVCGADLIMLPLPAFAQAELADQLARTWSRGRPCSSHQAHSAAT